MTRKNIKSILLYEDELDAVKKDVEKELSFLQDNQFRYKMAGENVAAERHQKHIDTRKSILEQLEEAE